MNYINLNKNSYDSAYEKGWGNKYPDSYMISLYFNYIRPLLEKIDKEENARFKVLDFGCSLGANTKFFENQGFEVYGLDISKIAIEKCVLLNGFDSSHFKACNIFDYQNIYEIFETKFDLIIASEVLYYFAREDVKHILDLFYEVLFDKGIIYANWATYNSDIYREYKGNAKRGEQIAVKRSGSIDEELKVYVLQDKEEMVENFSMFHKKYVKRLVCELEGENESLYYVGVK